MMTCMTPLHRRPIRTGSTLVIVAHIAATFALPLMANDLPEPAKAGLGAGPPAGDGPRPAPCAGGRFVATLRDEWLPLAMVALGSAYPLHEDLDQDASEFIRDGVRIGNDVDDVGVGVLLAAAGLSSVALPGQNRLREFGVFAETAALTLAITEGLKALVGRERPIKPDGRVPSNDSFPSGHSSMSFAAAGYLSQRWFSEQTVPSVPLRWLGRGAVYGTATWVGLGRIEHSDHFPSAVLAGAGIGILVSHLVFDLHHGEDHAHPKAYAGVDVLRGGLALTVTVPL